MCNFRKLLKWLTCTEIGTCGLEMTSHKQHGKEYVNNVPYFQICVKLKTKLKCFTLKS